MRDDCPLDPTALLRLAGRAEALENRMLEVESHRPSAEDKAGLVASQAALAVTAQLAAYQQAVGLFHEISRWADPTDWNVDRAEVERDLLTIFDFAVELGLPRTIFEGLLASAGPALIERLARWLDPERDLDREVLVRLLDHPRLPVQEAARVSLGPLAPWRWYEGLFDFDPLDPLDPLDPPQADHERYVQIRRALLREQLGQTGIPDDALLLQAVATFPDPVVERVLEYRLVALGNRPPSEALVERLRAIGGTEAVVRAAQRFLQSSSEPRTHTFTVRDWFRGLPEPIREDVARSMFALLDGYTLDPPGSPRMEDGQRPREHDVVMVVAWIGEALWSKTASPQPLFERLISLHGRYFDRGFARSILAKTVSDSQVPMEHVGVWLVPLLREHPWLLFDVRGFVQRFVDDAPREAVERLASVLMETDYHEGKVWALKTYGRLIEADASARAAQIQAWIADDTIRPIALGDEVMRHRLLPTARRWLLEHRLALDEATNVMQGVGELYGGVFMLPHYGSPETRATRRERRRKALAAVGVWVAPDGEPLSEAEWDAFRVLEREVSGEGHAATLRCFPEGPWQQVDLDRLDRAEAQITAENPDAMLIAISLFDVLEGKPPPDAAARTARLRAAWPHQPDEDKDDNYYGKHFKRRLAELCERFGTGDAEGASASRPAVPWMDEPEDDP